MTSPDAQDPRLLSEEELRTVDWYLDSTKRAPRDPLILRLSMHKLLAHIAAQAEMIAALEEQLEPRPKNDAPLSEAVAKLREIGKDVDWAGAFNDLQEEQRQSNAVEDRIKAARAAAFEEAATRVETFARAIAKASAQRVASIIDTGDILANEVRALSHQEKRDGQ